MATVNIISFLIAFLLRICVSREMLAWLLSYQTDESSWEDYVNYIDLHKQNLTSISLCPYAILSDGTFGYQTQNNFNGSIAEYYNINFTNIGLKTYPLIDGDAGMHGLKALIYDQNKIDSFIETAVNKAIQYKFNGYNLDIEIVSTNETDGIKYQSFINQFSNALIAKNMSLTSDITSCENAENYMAMTCNQYRKTSIGKVISMKTYTVTDVNEWKNMLKQNVNDLGSPDYGVGAQKGYDKIWTNYSNLDYAKQLNIQWLALWTVPLEGSTNDQFYWDVMGYWLQ
eukprot:349844_1